jgi:hypothetical protein
MKTELDPIFERNETESGRRIRFEIAVILITSFIIALLMVIAIFGEWVDSIHPLHQLAIIGSGGLYWLYKYIAKQIKQVKTDLKYKDQQ